MPRPPHSTAATVAVILAAGMSLSINAITFTLAWAVIFGRLPEGLGENTTQVLIGWGGGIIGVLGAFVGYAFGRHERDRE